MVVAWVTGVLSRQLASLGYSVTYTSDSFVGLNRNDPGSGDDDGNTKFDLNDPEDDDNDAGFDLNDPKDDDGAAAFDLNMCSRRKQW